MQPLIHTPPTLEEDVFCYRSLLIVLKSYHYITDFTLIPKYGELVWLLNYFRGYFWRENVKNIAFVIDFIYVVEYVE